MAETLATKQRGKGANVGGTERLASMLGGGALVAYGLVRGRWDGLAMAAAGGVLVYRGVTGHCDVYKALGVTTARRGGENVSVPYELGVRVDQAVTIDKPPEEVYRFWRNLENVPKFMSDVESVREIDNKHSHWVVRGPGGASVEWDAEVISEKENELIGWRSLSGSQVANAGSVHFKPVGDRGTEVLVEMQYEPPGGTMGATLAKLVGRDPARQVAESLRRLKQLMETGEIATSRMHSFLRPHGRQKPSGKGWNRDVVATASEESFPASDPPSWTPEHV